MRRADRIVARARALVGARFRAHGRSRADGLDCVGLVAAALDKEAPQPDYALRSGDPARIEEALRRAGLLRHDLVQAGDVLLLRAGPGQLHLGIATGSGIVHADAGLRRVVERPGAAPWPLVGAWREED